MARNTDDEIIEDLLSRQAVVYEAERAYRQSSLLTLLRNVALVVAPLALFSLCIASAVAWQSVNLAPYWQVGGLLVGVAILLFIITSVILADNDDLGRPDRLALKLERAHQELALYSSGARVALPIRQYAYRSLIQRNVVGIRQRGDRYRKVHNAFQSLIIVGSLATTTVSSLSPDVGPLKWLAVGLSFTVGLSAGFTGYFKYRERAFYLRQTADDLEEQLNAYELGLPPYDGGTEQDRISRLTKEAEAIRVAQQRREQQLDQPKATTELGA